MINRVTVIVTLSLTMTSARAADPPKWDQGLTAALDRAGSNRTELEKALATAPADQRTGMAFLIANMPDADLRRLKADYLLTNTALAYRVRNEVKWGKTVPEDVFLNDVLPYANLDEPRDEWRAEFFELGLPLVKDCKTPTEAAMKLNSELFTKLKVKYSTRRRAANQGPKETIASGLASCSGLSIVLADACRAVGVPARLVGTPMWADKRGNHTWVEIWDNGWHFTGACEADPKGLDRGWFVGDAARAKADVPEHAIYAASFKRTAIHFPLIWATENKTVPAENVTARYTKPAPAAANTVRLLVRVRDADGIRVAVPVAVMPAGDKAVPLTGTARDEKADTNDILGFDLPARCEVVIRVGQVEKAVTTDAAGRQQIVDISLPRK
ncbi:transglutaminase-like domain-containing protein [Fimbriiglobus ruber]|uniref:Transglutaminase-related protein n=1 Tax=Fimbriiglobus ruber TaxID=1908690 RepID=A0A225DTF4_9BACT|nr:transglutaminase domain-containing protein [Fimbriiglobus ruber]OWK40459.1 Transglutaminase-related protein [Fimbriiglobus ruber]